MSIEGLKAQLAQLADGGASLGKLTLQNTNAATDATTSGNATTGDVVNLSETGLEASKNTTTTALHLSNTQTTSQNKYTSLINNLSEQYGNAKTLGERAKILHQASAFIQNDQATTVISVAAANLTDTKNSIEDAAQKAREKSTESTRQGATSADATATGTPAAQTTDQTAQATTGATTSETSTQTTATPAPQTAAATQPTTATHPAATAQPATTPTTTSSPTSADAAPAASTSVDVTV